MQTGTSFRTWLHRRVLSRWYAPDTAPPWWGRVLAPLTAWFIRQQSPFNATPYRAPLIVVGNLTAGGSGKTPFVAALVKHLQHEGWQPGVICRGDGGNSTKACPVTYQPVDSAPLKRTPSAAWGDEAQLHAMLGVPVWQGKKRHEAAQALLAHHPEVNILISDDGLQHRPLYRDMEILMLNTEHGLGNGWLLPAGPLREPVERLEQVDAIILYRTRDQAPATLADVAGLSQWTRSLPPCFQASLELGLPHPVNSTPFTAPLASGSTATIKTWSEWAAASQHGMRIAALTGIAHPQSFFNALTAKGIRLAATHAFPDHYRLTHTDLPSNQHVDAIFVTEKDAVKCREFDQSPLWVVPSHVTLPEGMAVLLRQRLSMMTSKKIDN